MAQANALTVQQGGALAPAERSEQLTTLLRETVAPGLTDNEFGLFCEVARRRQLDPFAKQIYALKFGGRLIPYTGIDGMRAIAERTGLYEGQDGPYYCGSDGQWSDVWLQSGPPAACKVGVYRSGFQAPLYQVALWSEYGVRGASGSAWSSHPSIMLAKVAESLALRRAFPEAYDGLYGDAEIDGLRAQSASAAPTQRTSQPRGTRAQNGSAPGKPVKWEGGGQCPSCHCLSGKLHATSCAQKLDSGVIDQPVQETEPAPAKTHTNVRADGTVAQFGDDGYDPFGDEVATR